MYFERERDEGRKGGRKRRREGNKERGERERNIDSLFHPSMHSLTASCMCPHSDQITTLAHGDHTVTNCFYGVRATCTSIHHLVPGPLYNARPKVDNKYIMHLFNT